MAAMVGSPRVRAQAKSELQGRISGSGRSVMGRGWRGKVLPPEFVARYIEGFSHFVTSMTAPITSGWSISPGGAFTHWKAPPLHGAHP
jgi:hypothetical protein